jgi:hypothetical protein
VCFPCVPKSLPINSKVKFSPPLDEELADALSEELEAALSEELEAALSEELESDIILWGRLS